MTTVLPRRIIFFFIFSCLFFGLQIASARELFPLPPVLEKNVEFWIKIYTQYSQNEVVIHDSEHLDIIYEILNLDDYFPRDLSLRIKWRKVEEAKKRYRAILNRLARKARPIDPDRLSPEERRFYLLWAHVDEPRKFRTAARNVRGQKGLREQFKRGLERSTRYLDDIKKIFRNYGLPEELCYLPHVESSFYWKAYSKYGAAGLWQFTRSTGRLFLKINYSLDERLDPILATDAAARLLKKNYEELGTWPLAITAYNHGLAGMRRAKNRLGTDDFGEIVKKYRSRTFGFASKNFYAEFLAAKEIAINFERYFGFLAFEDPIEYIEFELPHYVTLKTLASKFEIDPDTLAMMNPAWRRPILRSQRRIPKGYRIKLPARPHLDPEALYARLTEAERYDTQVREKFYRVRPGDNLSDIARRFGTDVRTLMALNDIRNPHRIRIGQILEMPSGSSGGSALALAEKKRIPIEDAVVQEVSGGGVELKPNPQTAKAASEAPKPPSEPVLIIPAESEPTLASQSSGPEKAAAAPRPEPISSVDSTWGFKVSFEEPQSNWITVQPEETIGHFAEWAGLSARRIRALNNLRFGQEIHVGQRLFISFDRVSPQEFHRRRLAYHRTIQQDFFANYRVIGTNTYSVKYGDNIWYLCRNEFEVPFWLLSQYNPERNLLRLFPNEQITVPVVAPVFEMSDSNQMD